MTWRDERILAGDAADTLTNSKLLSYAANFNSLKVIDENTTPEERQRALRREFWRKTIRRVRKLAVIVLLVIIAKALNDYF